MNNQEMGRADTLRFNILTFVVEENYERATSDLQAFLEKDFEYPGFRERVERYILHAVDLVSAIRAKRKFPGAEMLTMAKQQELSDKFVQHFEELQDILKKIERIENDMRMADVRSTVWVVRSLCVAVLVIVLADLAREVDNGLGQTVVTVMDDVVGALNDMVFK